MLQALISFSYDDIEFVNKLSDSLSSAGVEPRRNKLNTHRNVNDPRLLDAEFAAYDICIPVLSLAYLKDKWLRTELTQSVIWEQKSRPGFVFPVNIDGCDVQCSFLCKPTEFSTKSFDEAFESFKVQLSRKPQAFVVMKFNDDELDKNYASVIRPLVESFGYSVLKIDEVQDSGIISDQILRNIDRSSLVIADLTHERPNCYFEAGYALAQRRQEIILIIKQGQNVHFDLHGHRFILWKDRDDLETKLKKRLQAIRKETFDTSTF